MRALIRSVVVLGMAAAVAQVMGCPQAATCRPGVVEDCPRGFTCGEDGRCTEGAEALDAGALDSGASSSSSSSSSGMASSSSSGASSSSSQVADAGPYAVSFMAMDLGRVYSARVSPNGLWAAVVTTDKVHQVNLVTGSSVEVGLLGTISETSEADVSNSGDVAYTTALDGLSRVQLYIWTTGGGAQLVSRSASAAQEHSGRVYAPRWNPLGTITFLAENTDMTSPATIVRRPFRWEGALDRAPPIVTDSMQVPATASEGDLMDAIPDASSDFVYVEQVQLDAGVRQQVTTMTRDAQRYTRTPAGALMGLEGVVSVVASVGWVAISRVESSPAVGKVVYRFQRLGNGALGTAQQMSPSGEESIVGGISDDGHVTYFAKGGAGAILRTEPGNVPPAGSFRQLLGLDVTLQGLPHLSRNGCRIVVPTGTGIAVLTPRSCT